MKGSHQTNIQKQKKAIKQEMITDASERPTSTCSLLDIQHKDSDRHALGILIGSGTNSMVPSLPCRAAILDSEVVISCEVVNNAIE